MANEIRKVSGAQAEQAKRLGLVKITRASALHLWMKGVPIIMVGSKVNAANFFGNWRLAHEMPSRDRVEAERPWGSADKGFTVLVNSFNSYLEPELGKPAFFLDTKTWV